jgi:prepilin-type N-terminal cleavage/methylation domain-containing protein
MTRLKTTEGGFTLIEMMVCLVIIVALFALSSINLGRQVTTVTVASATDTLLADLKSQQLLAMTGETGSTASQQPHGVYIQSNEYTLYANSTYNSGDSNNFIFPAPSSISFTTTLPSDRVLFSTGDGSVSSFVSGDNTITISGTDGTKTITINRFGAASAN